MHKLYNYLYEETTLLEDLGINKNIARFLFMNKILVVPPDTRPVVKLGPKRFSVNELTKYYIEILKNIQNSFTDGVYTSISDEDANMYLAASYKKFQNSVNNIYTVLLDTQLGEKKSIVRQSLLGKTTEFSGRTVITAAPNVAPYMVSIPEDAAKKIFILETIHHMFEKGDIDVSDVSDIMNLTLNGLKDSFLNLEYDEFKNNFNELRKDFIAVAERPPSLFMYNVAMVMFDKLFEERYNIK